VGLLPAVYGCPVRRRQARSTICQEASLILANEYYEAKPSTLNAVQKKRVAEKAVRDYGHAQWPVFIRPNAIADGMRLSMDGRSEETVTVAHRWRCKWGGGTYGHPAGILDVRERLDERRRQDRHSRILSWAVEHGAVKRVDSGTSTTLSTSPYALLLPLQERDDGSSDGDDDDDDTDDVFNRYAYLRRLGVAEPSISTSRNRTAAASSMPTSCRR